MLIYLSFFQNIYKIYLIHCYNSTNLLNNERLYNNNINYLINCIFCRTTTFNSNGGIILITSSNFNLLIELCLFHTISCTNQGGSIYFYTNSNISIIKTCSYLSTAQSGQFSYIFSTLFYQISLLSITKSSINGNEPLYANLGNHSFNYYNSSNNKAIYHSGILIINPIFHISKFSTFINNQVTNYVCIYLDNGINFNYYYFSNIINNNSPSVGVVYLTNSAKYEFNNCIFNLNQDKLFYIGSLSLILKNSKINHLLSQISYGSINTENNNTFQESNFQELFISNFFCENTYFKLNTSFSEFYRKNFLVIFYIYIFN